MAGNSRRHGARRRVGTKKGQVVGSGGQRRRGLRGRGPTPRAEDRTGHPAARRTPRPDARSSYAGGGRSELVAGRNAVVEALQAGIPVAQMYVAERIDHDERVRTALKLAADRGVPLLEAPRSELDRITAGAVHQGLALEIPPFTYAHPADLLERAAERGELALVVALDGVTDPRNLGAIIRSAAAFGAHGVLIPQRRSAGLTAGAWKASAGAAARLPVARAANLTQALQSYRNSGVFVAGLAADGEIDLADLEVADMPLAVVVGSEAKGLSRLVAATCDLRVRIPMAVGTESLNASVAAGIALYEIARRRG